MGTTALRDPGCPREGRGWPCCCLDSLTQLVRPKADTNPTMPGRAQGPTSPSQHLPCMEAERQAHQDEKADGKGGVQASSVQLRHTLRRLSLRLIKGPGIAGRSLQPPRRYRHGHAGMHVRCTSTRGECKMHSHMGRRLRGSVACAWLNQSLLPQAGEEGAGKKSPGKAGQSLGSRDPRKDILWWVLCLAVLSSSWCIEEQFTHVAVTVQSLRLSVAGCAAATALLFPHGPGPGHQCCDSASSFL